VRCGVLYGPKIRASGGNLLENGESPVGAPIVDDDNFMGDFFELKFEVEMLNRRGNATLLVPCGDDDRKFLQQTR
jgi:hypothetical protein